MKKIIIAGIIFLGIQFGVIIILIISHLSGSSANKGLQAGIVSTNANQSGQSDIISKMTLKKKVGQLIHIGMRGKTASPDSSVIKNIKKYHVGGVILFGVNFGTKEQILLLNENLQRASTLATGIPLFISTDQEGGRVIRVGPDAATQFPGAMALGQTSDDRLAYDAGFITGYELRKIGIDMIFAPVLDINNNPENPVIGTRSFGSNANTVSLMGVSYMSGLQSSGSTAVIKHFPGHGDTHTDSHLDLPVINKTMAELESFELIPFQKAIKQDSEAVMSAHILFPSLDNKYPATLSKKIIKDLLKQKMGYDGLVISDAMEMHAISKKYGPGEAAVRAFEAGVDIILLTSESKIIQNIHEALLEGFQSGRLSTKNLDISINKQIMLKKKKLLFERWESTIASSQKNHSKKLDRLNKELLNKYNSINKKYEKTYSNLNQEISRKSIRSLHKSFPGQDANTKIVLHYRSRLMAVEARQFGLNPNAVIYSKNSRSLYRLLKADAQKVYAIELDQSNIKAFNYIVKTLNQRTKNVPVIIGLYAHNPFLKINIPNKGAVFASFSPTAESKKALLYHLLTRKPVAKADLVLKNN